MNDATHECDPTTVSLEDPADVVLGSKASANSADSETLSKSEPPSPRYHDMDSLRAAMMLLGLVFHAAWFFCPIYFGHTLSDVGASTGYLFFFAWVHQFRMQVFFLIAGFFACLLIRKRGLGSFAKNRFMRVVVPLGISMVTLFPLMKLQYLRGGLESGRILSDEPLMTQYWKSLQDIVWADEWIVHLWFLHCLILIYAIAWLLKLVFDQVVDRQNRIRPIIESMTNRLTRSHLGPLLLGVPIAVCMAYDLTWFGIEPGNLKPMWAGVFAYWIFFGVGWCLYASPEIINVFVRRWPAYLVVGSLLSLMLCGYYNSILMTGKTSFFYPFILDQEIDYPSLRTHLIEAADFPDESSADRVVWDLLSPTYQQFVRERASPTSDQLVGFTTQLSAVTVFSDKFPAKLAAVGIGQSGDAALAEIKGDGTQKRSDPVLNRELLTQVLGGDVYPRWNPPLWIRAGYFYTYGVACWLMTFAMLGLFRQFLSHPSSRIRYLADSSYWLYLIHLPLQFEISIQLGLWEANGMLKFLIYNLLTFAILLPTYHYLVRPTWVGVLLNGRLYPLRKSDSAE